MDSLCTSSLTGAAQRDDKPRSGAGGAVRDDRAAMTLDNLPADGKANAGSLIFGATVEPLKHLEDPIAVLLVESDAVVLDRETAHIVGATIGIARDCGPDGHTRRNTGSVELQGVPDQVL